MADSPSQTTQVPSGLHDIKPLPQFSALNLPLILAALLFAFLAALIYYYLKKKKQQDSTTIAPPPRPPQEIALSRLKELEELRQAGNINIREFSTRLSVTLRQYLEDALLFPALENTPKEIRELLPSVLLKNLPTLPREHYNEITNEVQKILRFCERATFSDSSERSYHLDSKETSEALGSSVSCVKSLADLVRKEQERLHGVIAQSKLSELQKEVTPGL